MDFRNKGSPNDIITHKGNKVSCLLNDNNSSSFNKVETTSHKSLRSAEGKKGKPSERESEGRGQHADAQKQQNTMLADIVSKMPENSSISGRHFSMLQLQL